MKLAEILLSQARERGLRHFFGLPGGGAPLDMVEFGRQLGVDFVSVAHESSAAIMAAYYGVMKDTAGLALAIKGVGAGNLAGGAANAHFERLPVVCCCESAPSFVGDRELVSLCPHEQLFGAVVKHLDTLSPECATTQVGEAFYQATDGRPGPVLLDIPSDLGMVESGGPEFSLPEPTLLLPRQQPMTKVRELLAASRRPLILAGADVLRDKATSELLMLVEKLGAAVLVTMEAHGVFPERHNRWVGPFTGQYNPNIIEGIVAQQADFALLVGCDSLMSDLPWEVDVPTCELVSRPDYQSLATEPTLRVDGDLKVALKRIMPEVDQEGFSVEEIQGLRKTIEPHFARPAAARLAVHDLLDIMQDLMPAETILFSETGAMILTLLHRWPVDEPGKHFGTAGGRTMGLMLPAILGAKLARPDLPMIGLGADGSTLMRLGELEVFARMGIAVPLVIVNDQALGTMKSRQKSRQMPDFALDFHPVDFAAVANACGLHGVTVDSPEAFKSEFQSALMAPHTTLIDARVDSQPYQDGFGPTIGAV